MTSTRAKAAPRQGVIHLVAISLLLASTGSAEPVDGKSATVDSDPTSHEPAHTPGPSSPADPDLTLGATCPGQSKATTLSARLPTYAKELVLLWPRTGRRTDNETCVTVSRLTAINHQGTPLTISFLQFETQPTSGPRDFRLLEEETPPRAVLELVPDEDHPKVIVEVAGSPSTSRDTLEAILDFLDAQAAVRALVDSGQPPAKVRDP